jgi:hypothetical protein
VPAQRIRPRHALPLVLGQIGGAVIKSFNAPNRVVLGRDVRPGQQFRLAVFGMNGPLSNSSGNFIWVRHEIFIGASPRAHAEAVPSGRG